MKKLLLSAALIIVFAIYVLTKRPSDENQSVGTASVSSSQTSNSASIATATNYKDGTYTGSGADAFYGTIQVSATIMGGKITDVEFLQYPNDRSTSVQINSQAIPQLKQEAITAQNANVDIVSGATQSSQAFQQSLASALDKARS